MSNFLRATALALSAALSTAAMAQQRQKIELQWADIGIGKPYASGCWYADTAPTVPLLTRIIALDSPYDSVAVSLRDIASATSDGSTPRLAPDSLPRDFAVRYHMATIKKQRVVHVTIALAANVAGQTQCLRSAFIDIEPHGKSFAPASQRKYAARSALARGNVRKIKVKSNGIYKITYEQLVEWGFSDPRKVKVLGTGGYVYSCMNNDTDPDDLYENPLYFAYHDDGVFNSGDYVLFYGQGIVRWKDDGNGGYAHVRHPYADYGYYYVTQGDDLSREIPFDDFNAQSASSVTTVGDCNAVFEEEERSLTVSGRLLFGPLMTSGDTKTFNISMPATLVTSERVTLWTEVAARHSPSLSACSFRFAVDGTASHTVNVTGAHESWSSKSMMATARFASSKPTVSLTFTAPSVASYGTLDFARATGVARLDMGKVNVLHFASRAEMGEGRYRQYNFAGKGFQVWNVTDFMNPRRVATVDRDGVREAKFPNERPEFFVAFNASGISSFEDLGPVAAQDIHGMPTPDMVIVTAPLFRQQAERLARHRRSASGLSVLVLEQQQVFNEFSSGVPDVTAIRNMARMFYDRGENFSYLLLFGDGSYNNKAAAQTNNYVFTYQDLYSFSDEGYMSDDYFGLLDLGEGGRDDFSSMSFLVGELDIAVGRLPVETVHEASTVVGKIIDYTDRPTLDSWKNELAFLADDANVGDGYLQEHAYELTQIVNAQYPWFNTNLILMDAYPQVSTPAGHRYPAVTEAVNSAIHRGSLLFNYTGHGGPNHLAHEVVLDKATVNSWRNKEHLPLIITASCKVAPFDDFSSKSLGELMFLNPDGGAVSMFTTTREVYGGNNQNLARHFYNRVFERRADGSYSSLGDILVDSKNLTADLNSRKFALFGDPSMKLILPALKVRTDSVNGVAPHVKIDTIGALQHVTIHGCITDSLGNYIPTFNGTVYSTVFDKISETQTLNNDNTDPFVYSVRNSILYNGKSSVANGKFEIRFIVPLDINYDFGAGKVSYYAQNGKVDAQGAFSDFIIGGSSNVPVTDTEGPVIELYLNDTTFVSGSSTNESPLLLAHLSDQNGINTTGNGIGHEITARLQSDYNTILTLNDHYESDLDRYQSGKISYQLLSLPDGENQITLKVWDILNNVSERSLDFVVANTEKAALSHVLNYPNPFTTRTQFLFEHNQPHVVIDVSVQIFTLTGRLIKTLRTSILGNRYKHSPLEWDGRDDFGDRIGRGAYVYSVTIRTPDGKADTKYEKLVILK